MSKRPYGTQRNSDRPRAWGGGRSEGGSGEGRTRNDDRKPGRESAANRYSGAKPTEDGPILIFGVHAAEAALNNPARVVIQAFITENGENRLKDALAARAGDFKLNNVTPRDLDRRLGADTVHQGILLDCEPLPEPELEQLADLPDSAGPLIVLDQVTDPHNVGAILRSAAAFNAAAIITQDRHAPPESGVVAKSASGALEVVPWVRVVNLSRALDEIAEAGYWRIGLDGEAPTTLGEALPTGPVALVLGAEGEGMRHNIVQHCDAVARLPISGAIESLNVSNAAAIALYAIATRS
jgi:23S rRNA (guanosine2251-2'-O)-methyltransferase